jgi:hypothetical protein
MTQRICLLFAAVVGFCGSLYLASVAPACCPVGPLGKPVINADQTMIILWDSAAKTQHLIRKASFKSEADDFGFLVPTPTQPELNESGNDAFPFIQKLTEPVIERIKRPSGGMGCGCGAPLTPTAGLANAKTVEVLEEKLVAGFHASVLAADSATDLVEWLDDHGYAFSPEVEEWAKPYVDAGWKITALKIAKLEEGQTDNTVAASALRLTFETETPIFPYREPDFKQQPSALGAHGRLLRIYFIGEARYQGDLTESVAWSGRVAWSDKIDAENRKKILDLLNLPEGTGPNTWWLTEFEDNWAYAKAPSDLRFARHANQNTVHRPPIIEYVAAKSSPDVMACLFVAVIVVPYGLRKIRRTFN